jgi:hypothetical protein
MIGVSRQELFYLMMGSPRVILLANSAEVSGTGDYPFAGGPILPKLLPNGRRREFASSIESAGEPKYSAIHERLASASNGVPLPVYLARNCAKPVSFFVPFLEMKSLSHWHGKQNGRLLNFGSRHKAETAMESSRIALEARDPAQGRSHAYGIEAGIDLLGDWVVNVTYGRNGTTGRQIGHGASDEPQPGGSSATA